MNRQLAETVVAAFGTDRTEALRRRFAEFSERDWNSTRLWLHTSGMALYLLDRLAALGLADLMPPELTQEFSVNLAENRTRTADLFEEFKRVNTAFQRAGISYVNLKGFSLAPHAYADPSHRYQLDLDFLVARRDAEASVTALEQLGYHLGSTFGESWEFRAGTPAVCSMKDLYRVRSQKTVEIHLVSREEDARAHQYGDRIARMQLQQWNGFEFPALGDADKLLSQATHLYRHFQSEWTRTAWALEFANTMRAHSDNAQLWQQVCSQLAVAPEIETGVALATLVTARTFAIQLPRDFAACTVDRLSPALRLWMDRYEQDLVLTEHPGSKLYLLLQDVVQQDRREWRTARRGKLFPLRLPRRVISTTSGAGMRWKAARVQLRFIANRFRFHLLAGLNYKLEAAKWRKFVAGAEL